LSIALFVFYQICQRLSNVSTTFVDDCLFLLSLCTLLTLMHFIFPFFVTLWYFLWCIYDCPMYFIATLTRWFPVWIYQPCVWTMAATLVDLTWRIHRWERARLMERARRESTLNEWLPKYVVSIILHGSITSSRLYYVVNGLCIRYHITLCGFYYISSG
jgi:hypothetical protein